MSSMLKGKDVSLLRLGIPVSRATATIPQTATGNIFTVSGGRIMLVYLVGEVTTAIQNQACTLAIGSAPTVGTGSTTALGTASSIINAPVGTHFAAAPGGATATDLATQAGVLKGTDFVVPAGSITITTSASNTGSVKWDLYYVPYDIGASVAAA